MPYCRIVWKLLKITDTHIQDKFFHFCLHIRITDEAVRKDNFSACNKRYVFYIEMLLKIQTCIGLLRFRISHFMENNLEKIKRNKNCMKQHITTLMWIQFMGYLYQILMYSLFGLTLILKLSQFWRLSFFGIVFILFTSSFGYSSFSFLIPCIAFLIMFIIFLILCIPFLIWWRTFLILLLILAFPCGTLPLWGFQLTLRFCLSWIKHFLLSWGDITYQEKYIRRYLDLLLQQPSRQPC